MTLNLNKLIATLVRAHLKKKERIDLKPEDLMELCEMATKALEGGSQLARVTAPCYIVGDIHGQFNDLLRTFKIADDPTGQGGDPLLGARDNKFVFLGDYVDRGHNSLEVMCLLLALRCKLPDRYLLLRGNHEVQQVNVIYGFWEELKERFGAEEAKSIHEAFNAVFTHLPLAGLVSEKVLCMHGGLSPYLYSLESIERIPKPLKDPIEYSLAQDLVWADPMNGMSGFKENTVRGTSYFFGEDEVLEAVAKLGIDMIVRAHQVMETGAGFFAGHKLCTIFTAPGYKQEEPNVGAVGRVSATGELSILGVQPPDGQKIEDAGEQNSGSGSYYAGKEEEGKLKMEKSKKRKRLISDRTVYERRKKTGKL